MAQPVEGDGGDDDGAGDDFLDPVVEAESGAAVVDYCHEEGAYEGAADGAFAALEAGAASW